MAVDELSFAEFPQVDRAAWRAAVEKVLKGADFERRMVSRTEDGLAIQPLYDIDDATADPGIPGVFPHVRGSRALDARWRVEQAQAHPDPETANRHALTDLEKGVAALRLVIADPLATTPAAGGFAPGIVLDGGDALAGVLDGVMLDLAPVSLEAGSRGVSFARSLMALWRARGHDGSTLVSDFHIDPLAILARHGRLDRSLDDAFGELAGLIDDLGAYPEVRAAGVDLRPVHEAGAGPSFEIAAGLAHAAEAMRRLERAGVSPADAAARTTFLVAVDDDVFIGIAKLRALRRCWSTMVQAMGGTAAPRLVAETSKRMLTRRDAYVNILRNTIAAFAGGVGGADAVTVLPFTAALGLADSSARRMARNTQLILLDESALDHVVDPAGGSWYVEHLTDQMAQAAWKQFQELEAAGGFATLLENGELHTRIEAQWTKRLKALATRREMITGVSAFPLLDEHAVELDPFDATPGVEALRAAAAAPVMSWTPLPQRRLAEPYEALRDAADDAPTRPTVLLLNLGSLAEANVRATWIRNLVEAGGLDARDTAPLTDADAVVTAVSEAKTAARGAPLMAVLCSTDKRYEDLAQAAAQAAKTAGVDVLALAGRPGDHEAAWRAAGIDSFFYQGIDVLAALESAHQRLGIAA